MFILSFVNKHASFVEKYSPKLSNWRWERGRELVPPSLSRYSSIFQIVYDSRIFDKVPLRRHAVRTPRQDFGHDLLQ